jgi:CPA2 family monovalent cation:H+ antiporter-2
MVSMTLGITGDIALILIAAFVGGLVAHLLRVPFLVGYMAAGVIVGPHTAGPTVGNVHDIEVLADVGVALLLFSLGLEFPLNKLVEVGRIALIGTPVQMALTVLTGYATALCLGWQWKEALWFGAMVSFSSTMVVIKILGAENRLESVAGRLMLGMLIVQDLALLPMLIFLPALETPEHIAGALAAAALKAAVLVSAMLVLGSRVVPIVTRRIARIQSRELFQIWIAALGLGVGYVTYQIGLSFAFGAFMAGMVLSESDYTHQAESEIAPLRELFTMLFFASVGMLLEPQFLASHALRVLAVVAVIMLGKAAIVSALVRLFGYPSTVALQAGLGLCQIGEFSFVLARFGVQTRSLDDNVYSMILSATVASMILTPFAFRLAPRLQRWLGERAAPPHEGVPSSTAGHVVVAGFGRVGKTVAREVAEAGRVLVVIEAHPDRMHEARDAGMPALFGDASSASLLQASRLAEAALLVLTMNDASSVNLALQRAREIAPTVPVICRAASVAHLRELASMKVDSAVQPEMEGAIALVGAVLAQLGVDDARVDAQTAALRERHYGPLLDAPG